MVDATTATADSEVPPLPGNAPGVRWLEGRDANQPSELTRGLLNSLDRPAIRSITPTTFGTMIAGLLSAGLYPAVALPRKWGRTVRWHENILWHLAEWTKVNVGVEEGQRLHVAAQAGMPGCVLRLAVASALVALGAVAVGVFRGMSVSAFWFAHPADALRAPLVGVFLAGLSASFLLTWLSTNLNLRRLHNAQRALEAITPHRPPTPALAVARWEWGIRPVSAVLGLLLAVSGMLWALPMLIAATAQRRALLIHHRRIRSQMAHRVRSLIEGRRPVVALPPVIDRVGTCRNAVCDQPLPPDARFCARCGTPQRPISDILE